MSKHEKALRGMVEKFCCPGCVVGSDTKCGKFRLGTTRPSLMGTAREELEDASPGVACLGHVVGTVAYPGGKFVLGLPKGFNKVGEYSHLLLRLWPKGSRPCWDKLNVPVWSLEQDGHLFVRTFSPRLCRSAVDVVEGGTRKEMPKNLQGLDVGEFLSEID